MWHNITPTFHSPTVPRPPKPTLVRSCTPWHHTFICRTGLQCRGDEDRWAEKKEKTLMVIKTRPSCALNFPLLSLAPLRSPLGSCLEFCCMSVVLVFPTLWTFLSSTNTHTNTHTRKYHKLAKQLLNILLYFYNFFLQFFLLIFKF